MVIAGVLFAGCAVAETAPPATSPAAEPVPLPVETVAAAPAPPPEPEPSLQERWREPFAVRSRGRLEPRAARAVVVLRDSLPSRQARVAAAAEPVPAPAAPPAARGAADRAPEKAPEKAPEEAVRPAGAPAATARTHRVEWGETLYGIAREYRVAPRDLLAANPEVDPERLRSGQVLRIPASPLRGARRVHRVGPGDSLWGIARRYGVSTEQLRKANRLEDDRVRLGQTLVIPGGD